MLLSFDPRRSGPPQLQPGERIGAYQIAGFVAAGGMGEVYRALDTKLERDVAIKILSSQFAGNADRLGRRAQEARVLATLNHPNIAAIYGGHFVPRPVLIGEMLDWLDDQLGPVGHQR